MTPPNQHPQPSPPADRTADEATSEQTDSPPPVYRKPTLRRYDQIEQVRPYGPSERRAG